MASGYGNHKYYEKGKMKYGEDFVTSKYSILPGGPERFKMIKTSGRECFCGYYALNIGLGICGRQTDKDAKSIIKDYKDYLSKNDRKIHGKKLENINILVPHINEQIGIGYIYSYLYKANENRYKNSKKSGKFDWVETPFWPWASINYNVRIHVYSNFEKTWQHFSPNTEEELCDIYIYNEDERHYSAMEPVLKSVTEKKLKSSSIKKPKASPPGLENNLKRREENVKRRENNVKRRENNVKRREDNLKRKENALKGKSIKAPPEKSSITHNINSIKENIRKRIENRKNAIKNLLINYQNGKIKNTNNLKQRIKELRDEKNKNRQLINNLKQNINKKNYRELIRIIES